MARLVREYRKILSIAMAQTQIEQASSPSITTFTIKAACRNNAISETSLEASGRADWATSAGFMGGILSSIETFREHEAAGSEAARKRLSIRLREIARSGHLGGPPKPSGLNLLPRCQNEGY